MCPATNNHHPYLFPWSIHFECFLDEGHDGLHQGFQDGFTCYWS